MAVTMTARWDNNGTVIPGGDAEYVVAEQPIAEYDNWFNYNIVADIQAVIDDVINKFNSNTILKADTDNTPAALVVAEQTIVGRKTGNSIAALIDSEVLAIIGVEAGATADQTGAEIKTLYEAEVDAYTDAKNTKLSGIETDADVTDATNVTSAGAVMDSDFSDAEGMMRKTGAGTYTVIKSNLGAAVAPTVNDDSGDGYGIGSRWADTTGDVEYVCLDTTVGASVWLSTTAAGIPSGLIVMWHGLLTSIPSGWVICDGTNSTPDLRDTFVRGASAAANPGATGGSDTHTLTVDEMPAHTHSCLVATATDYEPGAGKVGQQDGSTGSTGGGSAHNNMPAYYAIAYIMKT